MVTWLWWRWNRSVGSAGGGAGCRLSGVEVADAAPYKKYCEKAIKKTLEEDGKMWVQLTCGGAEVEAEAAAAVEVVIREEPDPEPVGGDDERERERRSGRRPLVGTG